MDITTLPAAGTATGVLCSKLKLDWLKKYHIPINCSKSFDARHKKTTLIEPTYTTSFEIVGGRTSYYEKLCCVVPVLSNFINTSGHGDSLTRTKTDSG